MQCGCGGWRGGGGRREGGAAVEGQTAALWVEEQKTLLRTSGFGAVPAIMHAGSECAPSEETQVKEEMMQV